MGKNLDDIFAGMDCFEPRKAQDDPLEVLKQTAINNMHIFVLLAVSRMLKNGDVRLEAPKGSRITADLLDALNERLPRALEIIAGTLMEE